MSPSRWLNAPALYLHDDAPAPDEAPQRPHLRAVPPDETGARRVLLSEAITSLDEYIAADGPHGLLLARTLRPDQVVAKIHDAGLRGRGGAGFPAGTKWTTVARNALSGPPATVVVNGAEGEPATFKDRSILRRNPYQVIEGAFIAAHAVHADRVVIALKQSFTAEVARTRRALGEMRAAAVRQRRTLRSAGSDGLSPSISRRLPQFKWCPSPRLPFLPTHTGDPMPPTPAVPRAYWPHPMGPPALAPEALPEAQADTLATPRLRYDPFSRLMFFTVDVLYGRRRSLEKFLVLEQLARIPYQAWERLAQRAIAYSQGRSTLVRRIMDRVVEARAQQDNEQFHLLILEELLAHQRATPLGRLRFRILPRLIAGPWHVFTWLLHLVRPAWSYRLNANFEDHAEHEYMAYVAEHPELDRQRVDSAIAADYGRFASLGDLLRQIGHDERTHKLASLAGHDTARTNRTRTGLDSSARRAA